MTHETTPDIWLTNRILYLHRQCKEGLISFEQYETMVAQARLDKIRLEEIENSDKVRIRLSYGEVRSVIPLGLLTDMHYTPYVEFKMSNRPGSGVFNEPFSSVQ
jgi:hypothetical protein